VGLWIWVLTSDQFTEELNITTDQLKKGKKYVRDSRKDEDKLGSLSKPAEKTRVIASNHKVIEKIIKESNEKARAVLKLEQHKNVKTLEVAKFFAPPSEPPQAKLSRFYDKQSSST
jgi:hypothetical protein